MSSSENDAGLQSSAGLVRYFDSEENNSIRIDPRTILAFALFFGFSIYLTTHFIFI